MKLRTILYLVFAMFLLSFGTACRTRQAVTGTIQKDSVATFKTETFRDTTIFTPSAHVSTVIDLNDVYTPFKSDSGRLAQPVVKPFKVEKSDKHARLTVGMVNNTLKVDCFCDTLAINAKLRDTYVKEFSKSYRHDTVVQTTNKLRGFNKFLAWSGGIVWLMLIGVALFFIIKLIIKYAKYL